MFEQRTEYAVCDWTTLLGAGVTHKQGLECVVVAVHPPDHSNTLMRLTVEPINGGPFFTDHVIYFERTK